ncbi:MAG: AraC family transcriptional regulator [Pseudomonadota bacterium]
MEWLDQVDWKVSSRDLRIVQAQVTRYLKSFRLTPQQGQTYHGRVGHARLGRLECTLVGYGAQIDLNAGQLGQFSILQWPITGSYELTVGEKTLTIAHDQAHLIAPGVPVRMRFSPDCLLLVVRLSAQGARALGGELEVAAAQISNAEALGIVLDLQSREGAAFGRLLRFLSQEIFAGDMLTLGSDAARHGEDLFFSGLRHALKSPRRERLRSKAPTPRALARAEAFFLSNLTEPVALGDAAKASGVSVSRLTQLFRKAYAVAPMTWWRLRRLDRAYDDLSQNPSVSVTDVGLHWGFGHLGRFSKAYCARFGETPRQTLQRTRAQHAD